MIIAQKRAHKLWTAVVMTMVYQLPIFHSNWKISSAFSYSVYKHVPTQTTDESGTRLYAPVDPRKFMCISINNASLKQISPD